MSSIVVHPKNKEEFEFITHLLKKHGIESKILSEEEVEDIGLSLLMKEADISEKVSEDEVRYKLKN